MNLANRTKLGHSIWCAAAKRQQRDSTACHKERDPHPSRRHSALASVLAILGSLAASSAVNAQMTWVDTQLSYDFGFSGGLPIGGMTTDSRHFDTIVNPVVNDHSYSHIYIDAGQVHGGCDAYFFDPVPYGGWGLNHNFELGYTGQIPATGEPDPSTRTLWMNASLSDVLHVSSPMEGHGYTVSCQVSPWSLALLESGTWDGSTFTPSGTVIDLLMPYSGPTLLMPGDYRMRGELSFTLEATGPQQFNSVFVWNLAPAVPAPGAASILGLGGLLAARRRRVPATTPLTACGMLDRPCG